MNKKQADKAFANAAMGQLEKPSFFRRFAMFFESILIISLTAGAIYGTQFVNVAGIALQVSEQQSQWTFTEIVTVTFISLFGLLVLFTRYSIYLRKKIKRNFSGSEDVKRLAFFDPLTNLPNKALCQDRLEHAMARATTDNTSIAVLFIGIDDFKSVNNKQGNAGGDALLQEIAKRLTRELNQGDTLARVNGVEFFIILESLTSKDNITAVANKILTSLVKCYRISMQEVFITGNVGVAMYPTDGENSKELMNNANTAMTFAKEQGLNSLSFFSKELQEQVNTKKKIATLLRNALEKEELTLNYQPIIDTKTANIIGVEVLLRWNSKQLGEMAPDTFIPIAEEVGLINKIGDWVLTQACEQNKEWHQQGHKNLVVSVNLSSMQLSLSNYATTVGASLAASELEPQFLELEFTEDTLMKNAKQSMIQLKKLSELGVSIALDDFGMGYSSMKYLPKFTLNKIKIDGYFFKKIPESEVDATIVRGMTALAKQFKLEVTAEGVETSEQCTFIEGCGIEAMQGYHFSKPVPKEEFTALLQSPTWEVKSTLLAIEEQTALEAQG